MYFGNNRVLVNTKLGYRMFLDTRDIVISPIIALNGEWEKDLADFMIEYIKPGMNVVDVGANMGYFSCLIAKLLKNTGGILFAYEADPEVYDILIDNLALNWNFTDIETKNCAIYKDDSTIELNIRQKYKGNTSIGSVVSGELEAIGDEIKKVQIDSYRLDSIIDEDVEIDLIKIDVEGAELYALEGCMEIVKRSDNICILLEWSPGQMTQVGYKSAKLLKVIRNMGFNRIDVLESGQTDVSDNFLMNELQHGSLILKK